MRCFCAAAAISGSGAHAKPSNPAALTRATFSSSDHSFCFEGYCTSVQSWQMWWMTGRLSCDFIIRAPVVVRSRRREEGESLVTPHRHRLLTSAATATLLLLAAVSAVRSEDRLHDRLEFIIADQVL